jgi:hypothetical protein
MAKANDEDRKLFDELVKEKSQGYINIDKWACPVIKINSYDPVTGGGTFTLVRIDPLI